MSTKETVPLITVLVSVAAVPLILAWYGLAHRPSAYPEHARVLDLTGVTRRGVWTLENVHSLNSWWKSFEPATLHIPLHARVVLRLHSADVLHQFYVPELRIGPIDVEPGHVTEIDFDADQAGQFRYYCTSLCGGCHFYMSGWIVVTPPGQEPARPPPVVCPLCLPEAPPPAEEGVVAQGEYLYRQKACAACHGTEGRGGIPNFNYLNGEVIDHVHLANRLFLRDQDSAQALVDWISRRGTLPTKEDDAGIEGFGIVLARIDAAMNLIRAGKNAAKADLSGPEPPLQMPAWKYQLTETEILSIVTYLVTLYPWTEEEEVVALKDQP